MKLDILKTEYAEAILKEKPSLDKDYPYNLKDFYANYFNTLFDSLSGLSIEELKKFVDKISETINRRGTILVAGNGGNVMIANHFVHNLTWDYSLFLDEGKKAKAECLLVNMAEVTGIANDSDFDYYLVEKLKYTYEEGDLVIVFTGSGNSNNLINLLKYCKRKNIDTILVTCMKCPKKNLELSDFPIVIKTDDQQVAEDVMHVLFHTTGRVLRDKTFFKKIDDYPDAANLKYKEKLNEHWKNCLDATSYE